MKILIFVGHPAQVHFFKNIIRVLENNGHNIKIAARDKELTFYLLDKYGFEYEKIGKHHKNIIGKVYSLLQMDYKLLKIARKFKPHILLGHGAINAAHVARIINKPSIIHEDTENSMEQIRLYLPFTNVVVTPRCFKRNFGQKHILYEGYKELAYLHPNYFKPDPVVLDELGLTESDKFILLRFVSWGASHDIGDKGFDDKIKVVDFLKQHGHVYITSESELPEGLKKYSISISPEKIHNLLYFATLYIGESATMACESALLGTPSIFVSSSRRGYTDELEEKYGLVNTFSAENRQELALKKAIELLEDKNSKKEWRKKRERMLKEKIDVTEFMADFIERYPQSFYEYLQDES